MSLKPAHLTAMYFTNLFRLASVGQYPGGGEFGATNT